MMNSDLSTFELALLRTERDIADEDNEVARLEAEMVRMRSEIVQSGQRRAGFVALGSRGWPIGTLAPSGTTRRHVRRCGRGGRAGLLLTVKCAYSAALLARNTIARRSTRAARNREPTGTRKLDS